MGGVEWVVLYVRTNSEGNVVRLLRERLGGDVYLPFAPTKARAFTKRGAAKREEVLCFPGYVFIEIRGSREDFYGDVFRLATSLEDAYYFLYYGGDKRDIFVRDYEREGISRLLNGDFSMEASVGVMVGDRVRIMSGALVGLESCIKKINKVKRRAVVEMDFMGETREIEVMLEVVKKVL